MQTTTLTSHIPLIYSPETFCSSGAGDGLGPVGVLFQFLSLLKQSGPQKWVFDELADIAQMRFRFAEEEDACEYTLRLAADAPYYAPQHLLNGHYLYDDWQPDLVMPCYLTCSIVLHTYSLAVLFVLNR